VSCCNYFRKNTSSLPIKFLTQKKHCAKIERIYTYERDIHCLPSHYKTDGRCVSIPRGKKFKDYLAKHGLSGKIKLTSDMTESQIFAEISSVFKETTNSGTLKFSILQSTGSSGKSLTIPRTSDSYKWSASGVAGKYAKNPIYILADEPLKV